ncbi:hypothetical protein TSUD_09730 [Trifolium subterraneum]|nr:hypothetical protein TSUD_09730 [Trifolium subterraneum]
MVTATLIVAISVIHAGANLNFDFSIIISVAVVGGVEVRVVQTTSSVPTETGQG